MKKFVIIFFSIYLSGCINFKNIGSDLGKGFTSSMEGKDSLFSSIGGNLTKGAVDSVTSGKISSNLSSMLDTLMINFSSTSKRELPS